MTVDEAIADLWGQGIGAEIMGRNKFKPSSGPWDPDDDWQGGGARTRRSTRPASS
jgi:hypothetical protein